ncbi:MAG: iron complex transport system permease protein [Acidimicrobiales bacterium]|jgi:iron complex transport system permease protein
MTLPALLASPQSKASRLTAQDKAFRLPRLALASSLCFVVLSALLGLAIGPAELSFGAIVAEMVDKLPLLSIDSGLDERQSIILWQWRVPRVVLGGLVGSALAMSGAGYQGVFRNPLAAPFLLGVAAGAGLGATLAIAYDLRFGFGPVDTIALFAFVGAIGAVSMSMALGQSAGRSTSSLLLAGIAVASFLTAIQTFIMQRQSDTLREVYAWVFGRLSTSGWAEVALLAPYVVVCGGVLMLSRRQLDVLRLGEVEAEALGVNTRRVRWSVIVAASLLTAAAVAVSGIIAFVGLVIPHLVRLLVGSSYRIVVPLSGLLGAGFMVLCDVIARTVSSPAELPIGVVTAFVGAPFFGFVLWTSRKELI